MHITSRLIGVSLILAVAVSPAQALFLTWLGTVDDDWAKTGNWQSATIPDADDTARIWNTAPNPTVLHSGSVTLDQLWIGENGVPANYGIMTIAAGATLATDSGVVDLHEDSSVLTSNGTLSVSTHFRAFDGATINLNDDLGAPTDVTVGSETQMNNTSTLNLGSNVAVASPIAFLGSSSGASAGGSVVTGNVRGFNDSTGVFAGTINGNLQSFNNSSLTLNGTLNGNFDVVNSVAMNTVGAGAVVNGSCRISVGDVVTVAGTIQNGTFSCNGNTSVTVIEPTATIMSVGNDCWLYDTAKVTWNVGEDGSVGTIFADRDSNGTFTDLVRYTGSADLNVDLTNYDSNTHGQTLNVQLCGDVEHDFDNLSHQFGYPGNVKFFRDGVPYPQVDITYLNDATFQISNIPLRPVGTVVRVR